MTPRRGSSLIEVLVALPIIALIGVIAVQLLLSVHRQVIRDDGTLGATRELRQGAFILASELRGVRSRDVFVWSDTSIEFDATVGTGVVCAAPPGAATLDLVDDDGATAAAVATDADPLAAIWNQPPQAGDRITLWLAEPHPASTHSADTLRRVVRTLHALTAGSHCAGSPLLASSATTIRLQLADSTTSAVAVGTPARITRRTRYSLYRAGDGDWFLGRRTMGVTGWDVIQPVAGPLLSASALGLRMLVYDAAGTLLSDTSSAPSRVHIGLRAPRRTGRAAPTVPGVDSLSTDVVLRADRAGGSS